MCQAKPRRQREGLTTQRTQLPKTRHMCVHERVRTHTLTHTPWEGSTSFIGAFGFRGHAIKTSCWERKRLCVLGWGAGMREQLQFLQDKGQARSVPPLPWGTERRHTIHTHTYQYSCLENPMDRGAWQATVHRVAKSLTEATWHACVPAELSVPLSRSNRGSTRSNKGKEGLFF